MKHANDPGTIEMFDTPKRRGRPPMGNTALTPAERARRYRRKRVDRFSDVLDRPEDATVQALCKALSDVATHSDKMLDTTHDLVGAKLVAELLRRYPLAAKKK